MSIPTFYATDVDRPEMVAFLPPNFTRVLEIGCGEGTFAKHYSSASERWGVEPNAFSAGKAEALLTKVLVGTFEQVSQELPDNYFDLVICNDVIEHMEDHDLFLDSIKVKMREGGRLVGSLPNIRYVSALFELLVKKDWQYRPYGTLDRSHLRFFTRKSLLRTFAAHGYTVQKFHGINRAGRPFYALHKSIPIALIVLLTLGYYWDVPYHQFAFTIQK
jgi:2-polyprenyl-3-methyl-5-hydroxy-6-metoxy-1,4-benzoquinol methylase